VIDLRAGRRPARGETEHAERIALEDAEPPPFPRPAVPPSGRTRSIVVAPGRTPMHLTPALPARGQPRAPRLSARVRGRPRHLRALRGGAGERQPAVVDRTPARPARASDPARVSAAAETHVCGPRVAAASARPRTGRGLSGRGTAAPERGDAQPHRITSGGRRGMEKFTIGPKAPAGEPRARGRRFRQGPSADVCRLEPAWLNRDTETALYTKVSRLGTGETERLSPVGTETSCLAVSRDMSRFIGRRVPIWSPSPHRRRRG
jgi:hypothetical protein